MRRELRTGLYGIVFIGLIAGNIYAYRELFSANTPEVFVISSGKGTAALVHTSSASVLINAGADASILRGLGTSLPPWERSINELVLTNISANNAGGAPAVLLRYHVSMLLRPQTQDSKTLEAALAGASAASSIQYLPPSGTERITLVDGTTISILSPDTFSISYGQKTLTISSSTPPGNYPLTESN